MPNLYLDDVVINADLADQYHVERSTGQFVAGGWQDSKTEFDQYGVVSVARAKDVEMLAEGDRVQELRVFYANKPLYVTHDNAQEGTGTSDVLTFGGFRYRILTVFDYSNRGYWKAVAARMSAA